MNHGAPMDASHEAIQRLRDELAQQPTHTFVSGYEYITVRRDGVQAALDATTERVRALETAIQTAIPEYEYVIRMLEAHAPFELVGGEEEALEGLRVAAQQPPAASPATTQIGDDHA